MTELKKPWLITYCLLAVFFLVISGCGEPIMIDEVTPSVRTVRPAGVELGGTVVSVKDSTPANISPGSSDVRVVRLAIQSDQKYIRWTALKINLAGDVKDNDIVAVKIYLDNGDDVFNPTRDTIIGQGVFSNTRADIKLKEHLLVEKESKVCFITLDISTQVKIGARIGIRIFNESYFKVTDPLGVVSNDLPFASSLALINPTMDTLVISLKNIAPPCLVPGGTNLPLAKLILKADKGSIVWKTLKVDRFGTSSDLDVTSIRVYLDNGDGVFDVAHDTKVGEGTFSGGTTEFILSPAQTIDIVPKQYLVMVDINPTPNLNATLGIRFESENYFGVLDPDSVSSVNFPFATGYQGEGTLIGRDAKSILEAAERERTIKMQQNEFLSQKYYELALKLYREFKFNEAKDNLEEALRLNSYHREAQKLLREVQLVLGVRSEEIQTVKDFLENRLSAKIQETEMEVRNHFLNGERCLNENKFKEAVSEFEMVESKLKWLPYDIGLTEYRTQAQQRIRIAKERLRKHEEEVSLQQKAAAALMVQEEETRRQEELAERVKILFKEALVSFEQRRYREAERLADKILMLVPDFPPAVQLKQECRYARHKKTNEDYLSLRMERWRILLDDMEESVIPYAEDQPVRYDREIWQRAILRKPPVLMEEDIVEDPDILEIKRKLETIKHDLILDGSNTLYEITDLLRQRYNISIEYASNVKADNIPAETKILALKGLLLKDGLTHLLGLYGLSYTFRGKGILIIKSGEVTEELVPRIHDVGDLVRPVPDFPGPTIELTRLEGGIPGMGETEVPKPVLVMEDLINMIQANLARDTWEGGANEISGVSIQQMGESNRLVIIHTPQVQKEITEFLQTLRTFAGVMIAIDTQFLGVTDDFIEDIGVEFRDLTGDDTVGIEKNSTYRQMTARSQYSFQNTLGTNPFPIGQRLAATGGLGLQYTILGDVKANIFARLLQKSEKAIMLDAPKVMAMNGQRVHVAYLRQQSYIQDLEVIASQNAIAYEPIISTFQSGVVLDVKPVMSHDRKYVTLHLSPTLATLQTIRNYDLTMGRFLPWDTWQGTLIQLPWIQLQRARGTITVPDRGTLLLGGLKKITNRDLTAATPFMEKIPLLGMLFRKKMKGLEREYLMILVRPTIIDLSEIEREIE